MKNDIDTGKISTDLAQRAIDRLLVFAENKIKERWAKHKNQTAGIFDNYIKKQANKCRFVRTLIFDKQSADINKIYVPMLIRAPKQGKWQEKQDVTSKQLIQLLKKERDPDKQRHTFAAAITGPAGSGKSFFMRHLFLELAGTKGDKVPLFIEARDLNSHRPLSIAQVITANFEQTGVNITEEQARDGLESGLFIVLIDGFDELRLSHEDHYSRELEKALEQFTSCPFILSGRPSDRLLMSNQLDYCELLPLAKSQALTLLEKLDFDAKTKRRFSDLVDTELFDTHQEFLELPLLCVVMLLTYSDAGRISKHRHEFYDDAFNALWVKHDARKKAGYEREKYTGLEKQKFLGLLSAFCASSYIAEHFSMREAELSTHLVYACDYLNAPVKASEFIKDMTISTSLMQLEGSFYRFSHRTFQEYFCALHIISLGDDQLRRAIDVVSERYETDSVTSFIKSINPDKFERCWSLPHLQRCKSHLESATQNFHSYRDLYDSQLGNFLKKIRDLYDLRPTNQEVYGALDSWRHMGKATVANLSKMTGDSQARRLLKDIDNLLSLIERMEAKYSHKKDLTNALFATKHKSDASGKTRRRQLR